MALPNGAFRFPNISGPSNWSGANWNYRESGLFVWCTERLENARDDEHGTLTKITHNGKVRVGAQDREALGLTVLATGNNKCKKCLLSLWKSNKGE
jgi:hypothetical protein